ncbi:GNAT family N-acetyltransferase (plasmid) [Clostridium estertheticum]|uniref:GNAT family N-acetyltransferase n=1 Tax=Clostridium estertheticum TaxID=238834 RepID=UPI001C0BC1A3|nr:GNAT family N-acetyltransferase [Clostridium estertheticum]MBU3202307.1 GNAT family N-acetyltransferase [Clostridium estertheticum]WAG68164.1 GNAT family N-acetyltransferase [Clostridium estertheticum]
MPEIAIRNCSIDDFKGINVLMNQVHKLHMESRSDVYSKTDDPLSKKDFLSIINDENKISILAEINYIVVGLCIISIRPMSSNIALVPRKVAYMEDLCVHEDYRKQGIGRRLFLDAKKLALAFNVDSLELMVWEFNKNAVNFYENEGMNTRSRIMELKL